MTLRDKLRALTAPCREVDARLHIQLNPTMPFMVDPGSVRHKRPAECKPVGEVGFSGFDENGWRAIADTIEAPRYTASLDATVELLEREIPGWNITVWKYNVGPESGITHVRLSKLPFFIGLSEATHKLPAVALLLALLDAKGNIDDQ